MLTIWCRGFAGRTNSKGTCIWPRDDTCERTSLILCSCLQLHHLYQLLCCSSKLHVNILHAHSHIYLFSLIFTYTPHENLEKEMSGAHMEEGKAVYDEGNIGLNAVA